MRLKYRYAVVYEQTSNNYSAYVPDLSGCISTGKTWDDIQTMIWEAIAFHIEDLMEHGEPVPTPQRSIDEAMAYHIGILSEVEEFVPEQEPTIGMIDVAVEVDSFQVAKAS